MCRHLNEPSKMYGETDPRWNLDNLKAYFASCRLRNPWMSKEASAVLSKYYQKQRQKEGVSKARATVRLLQSCIRLAEGHARLMNHDQVTICDAINAILLLEVSFDSNPSFLPEINLLHTSFPLNPTEEYKSQAEYILTQLGLEDLWLQESERLSYKATDILEKVNSTAQQVAEPIIEQENCDENKIKRKRSQCEEDSTVESASKKLSTKEKLAAFTFVPKTTPESSSEKSNTD